MTWAAVIAVCLAAGGVVAALWHYGNKREAKGREQEKARQSTEALDTAVSANAARVNAARGDHDPDPFDRDNRR